MPTVQGSDNFGHGTATAPPFSLIFGAPTIVTSPVAPNVGSKTLSVVSTGSDIGARYNITGTPGYGWTAIYFRITSDWQDIYFLTLGATAGNSAILALNASRQVYGFFTGGGASSVPSAALSLDTWYWIEMITQFSATTRTTWYRLNGVDQGSFDKSGESSGTCDHAQFLSYALNDAGGTLLNGYWMWGSATSSTDWYGEPDIVTVNVSVNF